MKLQLAQNMVVERIEVGPLGTNSYLFVCTLTGEAAVIDPGADAEHILSVLEKNNGIVKHILLTHGHIDHIGAAAEMKKRTNAPILIHSGDAQLLAEPDSAVAAMIGIPAKTCEADEYLLEGMSVQVGEHALSVRETPGHSPGSVCFEGSSFLFCGDLVFAGSIGRTDLPGGSYRQIMSSIKNVILSFPPDCVLLPGHGPETTVGAEKLTNPYVVDASRWIDG
jgi:glyoxylase-like metal-dependent hydrolase (beta-lactamase superfamily II)